MTESQRVPDPPAPPDKMCWNDVERSIWRAGWTFGYSAAQEAAWQPDANYHDGDCPACGHELGSNVAICETYQREEMP